MNDKELIQKHLIRQVYLSNAEIAEIFSSRFNYENACMIVEDREFHVDRDEASGNYFWWEAISIKVLLKPDKDYHSGVELLRGFRSNERMLSR
jgi:hypothetical protein